MSITSSLSAAMHTREDGLIFLMTIFADNTMRFSGYPLAAIYRLIFYNKSPTVQHVYFVVTGLALYILSYGNIFDVHSIRAAVFHSILSILLAYWIVTYFPGQKVSIALAHLAFLVS
ncbi:unnamed protein product [Onchocerca flexuosa]|uniref:YgjV family protein n=1 Tax=Onchocerca flexuosa TaxID=387005 RepID=A0A183HGG8_9BILA|nr:unnamed protein product [Onchocerca flexuosa]